MKNTFAYGCICLACFIGIKFLVRSCSSQDSKSSYSTEYYSEEKYSSSDNYSSSSDVNTYRWIVGTWSCKMSSIGAVSTIVFYGDGKSGEYTEITSSRILGTEYETGRYSCDGSTIRLKVHGENYSTPIEIHSGNRLYAGGGYYYTKK